MQHLLDPIPVELSPDESTLLEEHREVLSAIGLQLEPFGGSTWLVRSIPALLINDDIRVALNELVADLMAGDLPFAANEEAKLITRVCKRAAIKGGQVLSHAGDERIDPAVGIVRLAAHLSAWPPHDDSLQRLADGARIRENLKMSYLYAFSGLIHSGESF